MPRLHATPITRSFPKTTVVFGLLAATSSLHLQAAPGAAEMVIHADTPQWTIDRHIYSQFAEHLGRGIYEGLWVDEDSSIPNTRGLRNDVVAALKHLQIPAIRWPGGCFADEYHWRDGIGPREQRPVRANSGQSASIPIGAASPTTTPSARTSSWIWSSSWTARPTSAATSAAAACRRCATGWNI